MNDSLSDNENSSDQTENVADLTAYDAVGKMHRPDIKTLLLCSAIGVLAVVWGLMGISPTLTSEIRVLTPHPAHHWTAVDLVQQKYISPTLQSLINTEEDELAKPWLRGKATCGNPGWCWPSLYSSQRRLSCRQNREVFDYEILQS